MTRPMSPANVMKEHKFRGQLMLKNFAILPFIVILLVWGASINDAFFSAPNLTNILNQSSILLIVVVAQVLVLLSGEIDISLESVVTLAPMAAAILMAPISSGGIGMQVPGYLGLLIASLIGGVAGSINGFLIVHVRLNAFITTLAMLILLRGIALGIGKGNTVYNLPEEFLVLGAGRLAGLPVPIWIAGTVLILMALFLRYHWVGRAIYAIGGNAEAARTAGINVDRVRFLIFVAAGVLAALAGIMLTGRISAATSNQGANLIFSTLAAAVIGGVSMNGGRGNLFGAFLGVILLGLVQNVLLLAQVATYWIEATYGAIIVAALLLSRIVGGTSSQ